MTFMTGSVTLNDVRAAKAQALAIFSAMADVVGVGITTVGSGYGLKVNLRAMPKSKVKLPTKIDGVPVTVEVVGTIRKRPSKAD